jgi:hypothetical protein
MNIVSISEMDYNDMEEDSSPDLEGDLIRRDSDKSWKASQGQEDPDDEDQPDKGKLFLVSLGVIMSLFT